MNNKLKYIRYSRKSSEAKEKQALSISDQNLECENYALREHLNVVLKLEESHSAYKPSNRPEFDKMVKLIEAGEIDAILTWHANRLCRNPKEGGMLLQLLQDGVLKEIRTTAGDIYTSESDQLILQIHFGIANQYSRDISRNVRRSLLHKSERGEFPRQAILGYEGEGVRGKRNMVPHSFEAPLIKEAYELVAYKACSLGYLSEYFHKKGLTTKRGKKISKSHWYAILTNPAYYGYFYYREEIYKGIYTPIVSKTLYDAVQTALSGRSRPKTKIWNATYNGIFKCKNCGCFITTTFKTKNYKRTQRTVDYVYMHCTHRKGSCTQKPITLKSFEKQLLDRISKISIDEEVWSLGIKLLKAKHSHEIEQNTSQRLQYQTKYNAYQDRLNRLISMRSEEEITKQEFITQKELLLGEQARVKSLLNDTESSEHTWLELAEDFLNTAFYARDLITSGKPDEKRNLIMTVGENFFLEDERLDFSFKKPYDILLIPDCRTNMLPR
ncbi:MAG TPA: recombinase family protein [Patescibacteria group bacterium]|nr:recombinase family protein [Patescibacteria group bacterium]